MTLEKQEGGRGDKEKEGEGSSQGTCINNLRAWATGCGLTGGAGRVGGAVESSGGKLGQLY